MTFTEMRSESETEAKSMFEAFGFMTLDDAHSLGFMGLTLQNRWLS